jgi:hypothetical protein
LRASILRRLSAGTLRALVPVLCAAFLLAGTAAQPAAAAKLGPSLSATFTTSPFAATVSPASAAGNYRQVFATGN